MQRRYNAAFGSIDGVGMLPRKASPHLDLASVMLVLWADLAAGLCLHSTLTATTKTTRDQISTFVLDSVFSFLSISLDAAATELVADILVNLSISSW
jgi:hypothetical protein